MKRQSIFWPLLCVCIAASCSSMAYAFTMHSLTSSTLILTQGSGGPIGDERLPAGWKRHQLDGGNGSSISVLLPGEPENFPGGQFKVAPNVSLPVHLYMVSENAKLYFVMFIDLPKPSENMTDAERGDIFYSCWRGVAMRVSQSLEERFGGTFDIGSGQQGVQVSQGRERRMQDFRVGSPRGRAQVVLANRRAYMLVAVWNSDPASESDALRFLNSFQVKIERT